MRTAGKRPDILGFVSSFSRFAGPNNPVLDLGNYLVRELDCGFAVVTHPGPSEPDFARSIRFPVYRELVPSASTLGDRFAVGLAQVVRIRGILERLRPDRIIVFSSLDLAFEASLAMMRSVAVGHNALLNSPHRRWRSAFGLPFPEPRTLESAIGRGFDHLAARTIVHGILAHSQFQKDLYLSIGIDADRIRIVPQCVDLQAITKAASDPRAGAAGNTKTTILFVGRLERDKGALELLEAAARASRETPLSVRIVGSGALATAIRTRSLRLASQEQCQIELIPPVPRSRLIRELQSADIVAVPSHVEAFGMVALEAMSLGKAILATRFGGISEVIRDGRDGVLIDPFDVLAFSAEILRLAGDDGLRSRLGSSAKDRVRDEFDVRVVAQKFVRALEELC